VGSTVRCVSSYFDPVLIPSVQNIFSIRVLQYQAFSSGLHDDLHTFPDILGSLTLILSHELDMTLPFGETSAEVTLAKLA
jgi:hypothetical protein